MAADLRYIEAWRRNPTPSKTPLHVRLDVPDGVSYAPDQLNPHNASKRLFVVPPLPEPAEMLYDFGAAIARYEERNGQWEGGDDRFTIGEEEAEDSATSEHVAAAASASNDAIGQDVQNAKDAEEPKPHDEQASKDVKEVPAAKEAEPRAAAEEAEPQPSMVKTSDSGAEDATQNEAKEATKAKADADSGAMETTPGDVPTVSRESAPDDSKGETAEREDQAEKDGGNEAKGSEERKMDRKEKRKEKKKAKKKAQREAQAEGTQAGGDEQGDEKGDEAEKGDIRKAEGQAAEPSAEGKRVEEQTAEKPAEEKSAENKSQEETTSEERIPGDKSEEKGPENKSEEKGPENKSEEKGPENKSEVQSEEKSPENEAEGKPAESKASKPAKDESTKESIGGDKELAEPVAEAASTPLPADDASQSVASSSVRRAADSDTQSIRSVDTTASVSSVRTSASTQSRTATSLLAQKERTGLPRVVRNQLTENEFRPPPSITGKYSTHPWSAKPYKMLRATDTLAGHPAGRDPGTTWEQVSGYGVVGEDAPKDRMMPSAGNALHALFVPDPRPWRPLRLVRRSDPRQLLLMCAGTALTPGEAKAARAFHKVEQRAPTEPALASYFGSTENTDLRGGLGFVSCPTPEMCSEFTGLPNDAGDPGRLENNFSRRLERPGWLQHTSKRRAALRSVLAALEYAQWEEEGFDKLVIATHHAWIVRGITEDIWEWRSNQWRLLREGPLGIPGENVPDRDLWELLDLAVRHYEDIDCNCRFWHIPRALNGEAVRLAERGALKDNQQPSTVRWTRRRNTAQAPVPPRRIPAVGAHNAPSRR